MYQSSNSTQTIRAETTYSLATIARNLIPGQTYTFTVDVLDKTDQRVSHSESASVTIAGAEFTLSAPSAPLQVIAGQTVTTDLTLSTSLTPYPEQIALYPGAHSGGLGLNLSGNLATPTPVGVTLPISITAGASMPYGIYTATLLAKGNGVQHTAELQIEVIAPTFALHATQNQPTLSENGSVVLSITADRLYGHTAPIWLEVVDSPSPLTKFDEQQLEIGQTRTLTITDVPFLDGGDYTYQIVGTDGVNEIVFTQTLTVFKPVYNLILSQNEITATAGMANTFHLTLDANLDNGWTWPVTLLLDPQSAPPRGQFGFNPSTSDLKTYVALTESGQIDILIETQPKTPPGTYLLPIIAESNGRQKTLEVWVNVAQSVAQQSAHTVYLPLILKAGTPPPPVLTAPDLVVTQIVAAADTVQLIIQNQGNAPVTDAFWVDAYINPLTPPTAVNQTWDMLGEQGLAWAVEGTALPIQAGDILTLTVGDTYYWATLSNVTFPLALDLPIYAQVDSADAYNSYGAVLETHEISGDSYNNIAGPMGVSAALNLEPAPSLSGLQLNLADLPPRGPGPTANPEYLYTIYLQAILR